MNAGLYVGCKCNADGLEGFVDATSQALHTNRRAECNQGHNQGVFDQVLTHFLLDQGAESNNEMKESNLHCLGFLGTELP